MVVLGPGKYSPRAYIARRFQPILTAMVHVFRVRQRLDPEKGKVGLMKVDGNKPVDVSRTSGARGRAAGPSGFAPALPQEAKPLAQVASTASLAGVDALLALQGVASPAGERAKAVRRGRLRHADDLAATDRAHSALGAHTVRLRARQRPSESPAWRRHTPVIRAVRRRAV